MISNSLEKNWFVLLHRRLLLFLFGFFTRIFIRFHRGVSTTSRSLYTLDGQAFCTFARILFHIRSICGRFRSLDLGFFKFIFFIACIKRFFCGVFYDDFIVLFLFVVILFIIFIVLIIIVVVIVIVLNLFWKKIVKLKYETKKSNKKLFQRNRKTHRRIIITELISSSRKFTFYSSCCNGFFQ